MLGFFPVPPQPTIQSLVMYCDIPLMDGRPVVITWEVSYCLPAVENMAI